MEGCALLPDLVAALLSKSFHGIWMVPSSDFQTFHYSQRTWAREILAGCADPDAAFANWMERDSQFGHWVVERALLLGLSFLTVNGSQTIPETADRIAEHFNLAGSGKIWGH